MLLGRLPRLEPEFTESTTPQPLPDTAWANICEGLPFVTARPIQLMDGIMAIHVGEDTLLIDRGDCVLLDGPVDNDVAVVLQSVALQKGWRTTILRDPSSATGDPDAAESEPALWFARRASGGTRPASEKVANGVRTEASRPFLSPMGRLGYRCLVDALGADDGKGAALDGLVRRADEEGDAHFSELLQRMAVVTLSCVPDPDETDLAALIETVAADEPPTARGWAEWKMHLHLALVASSLPGRGLAPRPRRDEPPTHFLAAAAETI